MKLEGVEDAGQELRCHIGHPGETLVGEEFLRTGTSVCLGLLLRGRGDTAAGCGCGLAGVGGR